MELLGCILIFLSLSSPLYAQQEQAAAPAAGGSTPMAALPGTIERTTKQHILAAIPPDSQEASAPFLSSPSGKYVASLLRRGTAPGAGGFGNDFCYVQVEDTSTGQSVWESECAPVSSVNTCSVVFTQSGLEVFDGSQSIWSTGAKSADENYLETLELVDQGDMRIRDKAGELAWKASHNPLANQRCGEPGSPGLLPADPPFAVPIGNQGGTNLPFGGGQQQQPQPNAALPEDQQQQQGMNGVSEAFGFNNQQPLVENNPYDSGSSAVIVHWFEIGVLLLLAPLVMAW